MKPLFECKSYKSYLQGRVREARGNLTKLARVAQCQPSYLSRVISTEIHLNQDQIFRLGEHWGLEESHRDYLMALLDYERSADSKLKDSLLRKMSRIRETQNDLKNQTQRTSADDLQSSMNYHSHWTVAATHLLCATDRFNTARGISRRLEVGEDLTRRNLALLSQMGLIQQDEGAKYYFSGHTAHIPKDSPVLSLFHNNWRQRSVVQSQRSERCGLHFTNVQTMSEEDFQKVKTLVTNLIRQSSEIASKSPAHELYALVCDIYKV